MRRVDTCIDLIVGYYLMFWANISLMRWKPRVILVTGSVGKTMALHLLKEQFGDSAYISFNANSIHGLPLNVLALRGINGSKLRWLYVLLAAPLKSLYFRRREQYYVVELDANRPGVAYHVSRWLRPEISLWISTGHSHAKNFDHLVRNGRFATVEDAIAREFFKVVEPTSGIVIYDGDNALIESEMQAIKAEKYAVHKEEMVSYQVRPDLTTIETPLHAYDIPYPLQRDVYTQIAMVEVVCGYLQLAVETDLSGLTMPPGRNSYFEGIKDTKLIDSTYNAHLMSLMSVLTMFDEMKLDKKWLVLGDIIEQGESEDLQHKELGRLLANSTAQKIVLIGRRMKKYTYPVLVEAGFSGDVQVFTETATAAEYIENTIDGGEAILFKGSQFLEGIVERLLKNPQDADRLPRRASADSKRRAKWGV